MSDGFWAFFGILFGLVLTIMGLAAWLGWYRQWIYIRWLGTGSFALAPGGLGVLLVTIGIGIESVFLVLTGLLSMGSAGILLIWQPAWFTPRWYRDAEFPAAVSLVSPVTYFRKWRGENLFAERPSLSEGVVLHQEAALAERPEIPISVGGIVQNNRRGTLVLYPDRIGFYQSQWENDLHGERFELVIPLAEIVGAEVLPRDLRAYLRGLSPESTMALHRRLRIITPERELFFMLRRPRRWEAAIRQRRREEENNGPSSPGLRPVIR